MFKYVLGYGIAFTIMVVLALDNPRLSKIYINHFYEDQVETYYDNKIKYYYEDQVETYYDNEIEYHYEEFAHIENNDFNKDYIFTDDSNDDSGFKFNPLFTIARIVLTGGIN